MIGYMRKLTGHLACSLQWPVCRTVLPHAYSKKDQCTLYSGSAAVINQSRDAYLHLHVLVSYEGEGGEVARVQLECSLEVQHRLLVL